MDKLRFLKSMTLVCLCACVIFAVTGCGSKASDETAAKVAEKAIEKSLAEEAKDADVTISKDGDSVSMTIKEEGNQQTNMQMNISEEDSTMVITGEDGNVTVATGASAGIPAGFPKDVPVHPSLKVNTSLTDGSSGFTINASSEEKFEIIVAYYIDESKKQGWTEQVNIKQNLESPIQMLTYAKGERTLNLVIQQEGDTLSITVNTAGE